METVELKNIPHEMASFVQFLKDHSVTSIHIVGHSVQVDNVRHDELKLLVHKFLHHDHLDNYKVHSQSGLLEIVSADKKAKDGERKGRGPTAPETMPYFFPG